MSSNSGKKKAPPAPQLARAVYNLEDSSDEESTDFGLLETAPKKPKTQHNVLAANDSDDDDDDSSLEILPPARQQSIVDLSVDNADENPLSNKTSNSGSSKALLKKPPPSETASSASSASATKSIKPSTMNRHSKDFIFSQSDSDDDDLFLNSKPTFETWEQIQERKRKEKELQKELDKAARAKKRQDEKIARDKQKQREKEEKQRQNQAFAQTKGKFQQDEIAVLMDPTLYENDPLGLVQKLSDDFLVHPHSSSFPMAPAAVQFIRKDYLKGGAKDAVSCLQANDKDGYEHIHQVMLVIEPEVFVSLLQRDHDEEDDDYPKLEEWLSSVQSKWRRTWKAHEEPRLLLILRDLPDALDKMWVQHRRRNNSEPSLPRERDLQDAKNWLLVQFGVECMFCASSELIQLTLHKMARALADKPYAAQTSELQCIKKIKAGPGIHSDDHVDKARDIWMRQLQQIPRVSQAMAENVVQRYPTCQSLWQKYQELLQNDNEVQGRENCACLLSSILNAGRNSQQKLSEAIFRIMTSDDPNQMIL